GRQLGTLLPRVRALPAPIGLGRLHVPQAVLRHPTLDDQPLDVVHVHAAPDALRPPRRVPLQEALVVVTLANAVYPAPAQDDIDGLLGRDRGQARSHLVDLDPDLVGAVVVDAQPLVEAVRVRELA